MCQFNLAIVDKESDDSKLKDIFERNGFNYTLLQNQDLNKLIGSDLKVIFTTKSHCDCGSAIGSVTKDNSIKRDNEKEIKKLKRKQWSDSKIQKYMDNKEKAELRKQSETGNTHKKELDNWNNTINDCFYEKISKRFGFLTHFYSGTIEGERFDKITTENCTFKDFRVDSLKELVFDRLLLIGR